MMNNVHIRIITNNTETNDEIACYIKETINNIGGINLEMTPLVPYAKIDAFGVCNACFQSQMEISEIKKLFADKWADDIADSNNEMIGSHIYFEHINFLWLSTY